ncbi:hypothetical protein ABZ897_15970 [Nonomuraea sp. NPDC046802]|uniref:hypothetical protein n=1 Tax=Nonomuraea sp. NPDC046802 TaxID=3154919 RepID=UPI0033ED78EC
MPIYLEPPAYKPGGPDGKGWNRLSLNAHMGMDTAHCALRPRSYGKLYESQDTRRASWAGFGSCVNGGHCDACPVLTAKPTTLRSFTQDVLIRIDERGRPWLMNKPEQGWASSAERWTWDELARLQGWLLGDRYEDEHGEGFWLRAVDEPANSIYGSRP